MVISNSLTVVPNLSDCKMQMMAALSKTCSYLSSRFRCTQIVDANCQLQPFNMKDKESTVKNVIEPMASDGLRTLSLAYRDFAAGEEVNWEDENSVVTNLNCVAIVGIEDPVRDEVLQSLFLL